MEDGEDRKHGAIKKAISSVVRRVSLLGGGGGAATRRGSAKPTAGSSDTGSDARHRSSSRQSWNPEAFEAASEMAALHLRVNPGALAHSNLYGGHDADANFEWSMDDDVILPVHTVSQSGLSVRSGGYAMENGVVPTIARLGLADPRRNSARLKTPEGKQPPPSNYFDYNESNSTPKGSHMSLTSKSRQNSMRSTQDYQTMVDMASIPVSSIPVTISPAEAAKTPRASLIPVVMTSELPVPKGSRHSLLRPPSRRVSSSMYTDASMHSSSMAASVGSNFTPPVAPRDRRRSGMPDAFAVPVQTLAIFGENPEELAATDAHTEAIHGDPKFEPYRDMLKSGATEIEVADAMAFFGVDHVAFFGRNILEEAGLANQPSEQRQRENRMWIEKRKLEREQQQNTKKDDDVVVVLSKAKRESSLNGATTPNNVVPVPARTTISPNKEDKIEIEQKETFPVEAESDTLKELRQTQERLSNLGVIPGLVPPLTASEPSTTKSDDVEAKQAEADLLQRYREAHREQMEREKQEREVKERDRVKAEVEQASKLESIVQANREQLKLEQEKEEEARRKEAEALARFNEATKAEREALKQRQEESKAAEAQLAAETFAKYQQKQEEEETKLRTAREEERKKQDLLRRAKEDEQARLQAETQRELEAAKKREEVDVKKPSSEFQQQEQEDQQRNARESQRMEQQAKFMEQQKRHREEEELRLKALEERIEKERNRASLKAATSPPPIPPTRPQPQEDSSNQRKADSNASAATITTTTKQVQDAAAEVVTSGIGEMEGNLLKKTKGGQWHTRAFTLRNKELSWVRSDQKTINKLILTSDSQVRDVPVGLKKFMFEVTVPGSPPLMLSAAGIREKSEWIRCIQYAITGVMQSSTEQQQQQHRRISLTMLQGKRLTTEGAIFAAARASAAGGSLPTPPSRPQSIRSTNSNGGSTTSKAAATSPASSPPTSSAALKPAQTAATANEKIAEKLSKFAKQPQTVCSSCGETVYKMEEVSLKHKIVLHRRCFVCAHCKRQLTLSNFVQHTNNKIYCQNHYNELFLGDNATTASTSNGRPTSSGTTTTTATTSIAVSAKGAAMLPEIARVKDSNGAASVGSEGPSTTTKKLASRLDPAVLSNMLLPKKPSLLRMAGGGGSGMLAVRSGPGSGAASASVAIDNSAALSKPIVPRGRRRQPSMLPTSLAKTPQLGTEPIDRMTSECTFKILFDPSDSSKVLWMHATSRPERDHWVNCLCNVIQALEMKRALEDAQKIDMISALQAQTDLEDFLTKNEIAYSGYCEKLSMKSRRNWKRRWFELSDLGEIKYSEDESKRIKKTILLTHRSIVLDAHDNRLSGPLAVRSTS